MRGRRGVVSLVTLAFGLLALVPPAARGAAGEFTPADYVVVADGTRIRADVWQARIAGEMVIVSSDLPSPVRVILRDGRVETLQLLKVDQRPDGSLRVLPDATERPLGRFRVSPDGQGISFEMDGRSVELRQKPPLLGRQELDGMKAYSRDYVRLAEAYQPSVPILNRLRSEGRSVRVEVYFGTWCPTCQQMVPRIMKVADELAGSNIDVDFYGLPQGEGFSRDPKVKSRKIKGVPTAVVYIDDRESGRIHSNGWKIPELTLNSILVKN